MVFNFGVQLEYKAAENESTPPTVVEFLLPTRKLKKIVSSLNRLLLLPLLFLVTAIANTEIMNVTARAMTRATATATATTATLVSAMVVKNEVMPSKIVRL